MELSEKLYSDFTTIVLPKIHEGLQLTKEYTMELSGRYIQYNLVKESYEIILFLIAAIVSFILMRMCWKQADKAMGVDGEEQVMFVMFTILFAFTLILTTAGFFANIPDIFSWIFIPEINIARDISNFVK